MAQQRKRRCVEPLFNAPPTVLASRLIYSGLDAVSGETFARADHASGLLRQRIFGRRRHRRRAPERRGLSGTAAPIPNTLSNVSSGHIGYATIDLGYNFLQTPGAKLGPFVGYNYYTQAINTSGCAQLAGITHLLAPVAPDILGLTQNNHINSLRVGVASEVMLTDRLKLRADAAYVPWVNFAGLDDHLLRQLLVPDASNSGNGVMLEATLDYTITPAWSVGVGGRYWAWNINTGTAGFNFLTTPADNAVEPARYSTERYGGFVQTSYRWGDVRGRPQRATHPSRRRCWRPAR